MEKLRCIDVPHKECTGCRMCSNVCFASAIDFVEDECGFAYPTINEELCISCGLCHSKCPIVALKNKANPNFENPLCFAFESSDSELVKMSSSGGAFSTLADWVLDNGGSVCGARFNYDQQKVEHILINSKDELPQLRTSKYFQSDTKNVYKEVKKQLDNDKYVLFTGCGCQVAAMKSFLQKDYPKLILVDIVCHGVPSRKVFNKFVESLNVDSKVTSVNFREKKQYGWTPTMDIKFENGDEYYKPKWECEYYNVFLNGLGCRLSCGDCHFNKLPRQGDLTFADFWDIAKYDKEFEGSNGVSLVLFNNLKHTYLIDVFKNSARIFKSENLDFEKQTNGNIFRSSSTNPNRRRFFSLLKKYNFKEALSRTVNRHFEIGIVGWWYGRNYGSFLTYFALNKFLIENGYDVLMLSWPYKNKPFPPANNDYVQTLINEHYDYSISRTFDEYPEVNKYCDMFMIGSDQMWNYWDQKGMGYYYFLDFVDDKHPMISYSTSFGHKDYLAPKTNVEIQKVLLKRFSAISVREYDGVDICKNYFDIKATRTIDPVFLVNTSYYEGLIAKSPTNVERKYLFCYILTPTKEKGEILKSIASNLNLELVIALDGQVDIQENREKLGIDNVQTDLNVSQWLSFIKNADYVITDSFHGVCFSVIFKKQFSCMINKQRGSSRFDTLLDVLNLKSRAFEELEQVLNGGYKEQIDYDSVFKIINKEVEFSSKWLLDSVENALEEKK